MKPPSVLTPFQRAFLRAFFKQPAGEKFFLAGGTALAEYYLQHRYSQDIDLFTLDEDAFAEAWLSLPAVVARLGGTYRERVSTITFRQMYIHVADQPELKIDFVRDAGPQFGEHQVLDGVIVDSELDLAVNKVTALFGRAATKDFVDVYFLLKKGYNLDQLIELAKEKDPGFSEFYFAIMLRQYQRIESISGMIKPLTLEELHQFFESLSRQVMLKIKPSE